MDVKQQNWSKWFLNPCHDNDTNHQWNQTIALIYLDLVPPVPLHTSGSKLKFTPSDTIGCNCLGFIPRNVHLQVIKEGPLLHQVCFCLLRFLFLFDGIQSIIHVTISERLSSGKRWMFPDNLNLLSSEMVSFNGCELALSRISLLWSCHFTFKTLLRHL